MQVIVTSHSVRQYRDKVLRFTQEKMTDDEIRILLALAAEEGSLTRKLPGNAAEYEHGGLFVTIVLRGDNVIILTCNGDREWRHWWRRQEVWSRGKREITAAL